MVRRMVEFSFYGTKFKHYKLIFFFGRRSAYFHSISSTFIIWHALFSVLRNEIMNEFDAFSVVNFQGKKTFCI